MPEEIRFTNVAASEAVGIGPLNIAILVQGDDKSGRCMRIRLDMPINEAMYLIKMLKIEVEDRMRLLNERATALNT